MPAAKKLIEVALPLDAIIAHIYGLTEHEFAYVLSTFPLVAEPVKVVAVEAYREVERGVVQ